VMRGVDGTPLEIEYTRSYFYDVLQGLHYRMSASKNCALLQVLFTYVVSLCVLCWLVSALPECRSL
jgi:hypothetical protein